MDIQTVVFIGPQGSGKGTQVRNLTAYIKKNDPKEREVFVLESGALMREVAGEKDFSGQKVDALLKDGRMIPFFFTVAAVTNVLRPKMTATTHVFFDGFPRNLEQAAILDEMVEFYERPSLTVVVLDAPDEVVTERLLHRGRSDDVPDLIARRLAHFRERTEPLLAYYEKDSQANVVHVDATKPIEAVRDEIIASLI